MQKYNKVLVLSILYVLLFMIAFVSGLQNPFGVIVKEQFGASNAISQISNLANFIAYALMGYPAGKLLTRKGYKFAAMLAAAIGFVGVGVQMIAGISSSLFLLITGAFIAGFSMCLMNTLVNPLLNIIGGGGKAGNQLLQYGGSFYTIGGMVVPFVVGMLISSEKVLSKATPVFIFAMVVFAIAFVVIRMTTIPEPGLEAVRSHSSDDGSCQSECCYQSKYSCLSFRHFVLGALAVFLYMGVEVGIANTSNLYLTNEVGFTTAAAGAVISLYWLFMVLGRILAGVAGARFSSKTMLAFVSSVSFALVVLAMLLPSDIIINIRLGAIPYMPLNILLLLLCGMCVAVMWGNIFNLAVEGLGRYTSAASGVFMMMVCGGGIVPAFQGLISDHFGYMPSFILVALCLAYVLYYAAWGYRNVNKDIPV